MEKEVTTDNFITLALALDTNEKEKIYYIMLGLSIAEQSKGDDK